MATKLYVGGLPYSVTESQLEELFSQHGEVRSAKVITDKFTGRSRGFGFVELGSDDEGRKAIEGLNGTQLEGRNRILKEAKEQGERRPGGGERGRGGGDFGGRNRW